MRPLPLALALSLLTAPAAAQTRITRPVTITVPDAPGAVKIELTNLDIDARIVGHLAETSMTMTFHNPTGRALAGDLVFPLPAGSTVSGYALDVNGALVDGVVVDKQKARQVFEAEVRKGVDPGLVERVAGAAFRTRVFPIPARGERRVKVSWVSELDVSDGGALFHLPLGFEDPVDGRIRVDVVRATEAPRVVGKGLKGLDFGKWEDRWVAETALKKAVLTEPVAISLPDVARRPVAVERSADGFTYVAVHDRLTPPPNAARMRPQRIAILWDRSGSRAGADHERELAVIAGYASTLAGRAVTADVVTFADVASPPVSFRLPDQLDALLRHLQGVDYDGGTSLGALAPLPRTPDLALLFSDGISNFGPSEAAALGAPIFAFNGAAVANHDALRALALGSGGAWIDLTQTEEATAVDAIGRAPFGFRGAAVVRGAMGEAYPRIAEPVDGGFSWVGRLEGDAATIALAFGGGGAKDATRTYEVDAAQATDGELLRRFWAQKKVADLAVGGARNEPAMAEVGKRHGVVTPGTSLLVLERLDQYIEHGVRPPASLPSYVAEFDAEMTRRAQTKQAEEQDKLEAILALWQDRVAWWEREFVLQKVDKDREKSAEARGSAGATSGSMEDRVMAAEAPSDSAAELDESPRPAAVAGGAPPAPMKKAKGGEAPDDADPPPSITLRAWDPDTPYLSALKSSKAADRQRVYMEQRATWGTAPAFFLDCADFFFRSDDGATALRVLSNIAELELEDAALLRILAQRLLQLEEFDLSILTFERVRDLRPDEPQSHRDLALALARRADSLAADPARRGDALSDYQAALDGLARVVMERWDRFAEIELIALVELNNILDRGQRLGALRAPIDGRLIRNLDMDVRIVMTWDADMTDMDLHVDEPSGEEAYYGHNRTVIGGRVSRDFTQGYGPEEYSIRKAMKGTYRVKTKFFGSSAATLQGAVTLQVDVYTDYGRPTEQRQSMTLRLTENKEMFTVGDVVFEGPAPRQITGG
jgi:Ca-activated chloride channel family protein